MVGLLGVFAVFVTSGTAVIQSCSTNTVLSGSDFEIDAIVPPPAGSKNNTLPTGGANLKRDGSSPCIDWNSVNDAKQPDATTGSNDNSFGQGTSENDPVPTIVSDSIPPNKSDLLNFGVYEEQATTKTFVALYWARVNSPSGTTNMDFEINQNSCDPSKPQATTPPGNVCSTNNVTPARLSGDKLVIFNLSSGGTVVAILLRTWNGSAWVDETTLNTTGKAIGSINYDALGTTADNDGLGVLSSLTFGEVVVDFQALLGSNQTCGSFGSVYLKSRSSDSFSAEMKDFIAPKPVTLTNCASISTQASGPVTVGQTITDTATLGNVSSGAGGTITFRLYAPGDTNCGTAVFTSVKNVSGPGNYTSDAYTTTQVGTYKWIASYSGDTGNSAIAGSCGDTGESSTVNKASPLISTSATGSVTIGGSITDSATLSGGVAPTGTITFSLYGPDNATCSGTAIFTATATVNGNGTYAAGSSYTPTAVGTYRWIASYGGDGSNNAVSGACNDANEASVVGKAPTTIGTTQTIYLQDSVTISAGAGGTPTGNVVFELYGPGDTTCAASPVYTETKALSGGSASTTNTGYSVTAASASTYRWKVVYGGDATHTGSTSACGTERSTLTIANS